VTNSNSKGVKYDEDKSDYTLLPGGALDEIVAVLQFGAKKYNKDNWQKVPDMRHRYTKALFRHAIAYSRGETHDPESGFHHLAHAACCCLFIIWQDTNLNTEIKPTN